jgi:hypothetical protein
MTEWRRGTAAAALFGFGGCALVGGTTLAAFQAIQLVMGVTGWAWWVVLSGVRFPGGSKPKHVPFPTFDFLTPGLLLVVGVLVLLLGWVALIKAATLAWPDRRDRSIRSPDLSADAKRMLTGD